MRNNQSYSALALSAALFLGSCVGLPEKRADSIEDALTTPSAYETETMPELQVVATLLELFDDPALTQLTEQVLANNPDLLRTYAQMEEAGFNFQKTRGRLLPTLSGNGSASRTDSNVATMGNRYTASLDVRWEVDAWGELRNQSRASAADLAASEARYESSRQSLAAQTMQAWFNLIAAEKRLTLVEKERDSFASTSSLVERRYKSGTATSTDVALAQTDAASAQGDYVVRRSERDERARIVKSLRGTYPDAALQGAHNWPQLDRIVPSGLPSELLLARPDIIAAYQNIRATDARSRAAYADLFPSFALTANGGRSSDTLSDLGRSAFDVWSLAGQVAAPIFEGGQRRAEVGAAEQRAEQAYQNYRSVVIDAFLEVEDALKAETYLAQEEQARLSALEAARRATTRSLRDYEFGLIDLLDLLQAQRRVFNIEAQTINLHNERLSNRVSLALALGKGV